MTNATLMSEAGHSELGFWDNTGASSGEGGWGGGGFRMLLYMSKL